MIFEPSETVTRGLFDHLVASHGLGHRGFHGKDHWLRVLHNGRELAAATGGNLHFVDLFALLHDSKREDEDHEPDHGRRAAEYVRTLQGLWFSLENAELELLCHACALHSDGFTQEESTVQECISKCKARVGHEFGCKVSIAAALDEGPITGMRSFPGNPYDCHTLAPAHV